jgi:hypothetical protein
MENDHPTDVPLDEALRHSLANRGQAELNGLQVVLPSLKALGNLLGVDRNSSGRPLGVFVIDGEDNYLLKGRDLEQEEAVDLGVAILTEWMGDAEDLTYPCCQCDSTYLTLLQQGERFCFFCRRQVEQEGRR